MTTGGVPGGSVVKNPPAMLEMWVQTLGWEDILEERMQPIPVFMPEKPHGQRSLQESSPQGRKAEDTTERLSSAR